MKNNKLYQEKVTIEIMIRMFCRSVHGSKNSLCEACNKILIYSQERISHCPFQENKPVCSKCKVHCYRKEERDIIRRVMTFSGPRMIFSHPILAIRHLLRK